MYLSKLLVATVSGLIAVVIVGMGIALTVVANNDSSLAGTVGSTGATGHYEHEYGDATSQMPESPPILAAPEDYEIEIVVLSEKCYGTYGCNVTYTVSPAYVGTTPASELGGATVIYEVTGDNSGPQTASFPTLGGEPSITAIKQGSMTTPSVDTEITATVTRIVAYR